jgi:transposase
LSLRSNSVRLAEMRPYCRDLRDRVIAAIEANLLSQAEVAETFSVSLSTVEKWWRCHRETGYCTALPHSGGVRRTLLDVEDSLRAEIDRQPDLTLEELGARVAEARGVKASLSMMCRELQRPGSPRGKSPSMTASGIRRGCNAFVTPSPSW